MDMIHDEHKLNAIALDIETAPLPDAADAFDESEVKVGNLKDSEKIKAKVEQAKEEFVSKAALNWLTGRITCICLYNDEVQHDLCCESEKVMLESLWQILNCYRTVITYNGHSFDMQFIIMRSLIHGLDVDLSFRGSKYIRNINTDKHVDLINVFDSNGTWNGMGKVCKAILGEEKTGTGAEAIELWNEKKYSELAAYCMKDAVLTWKLWKKIGGR